MFHPPGESYESAGELGAHETVARGSVNWREAWRLPFLIFLVSFGIYAAFAGERLKGPSADNHFVYLAQTFNSMVASSFSDEAAQRREGLAPFELEKKPHHRNDWASYWEIRLQSGEEFRGVWVDRRGSGSFQLLDGRRVELGPKELRGAERTQRYFVSFPPAPAVLMMPAVALFGWEMNDVLWTIFFAALNVALIYVLLRRLSQGGRSGRSRSDDLWLTLLFGFGTAHFWCSVLGQVWFTALIMGVTFTLLYVLCAIDARRPLLAGIFMGLAFATRTPLVFSAVFFYLFLLFPGGKLRTEGWQEALKKGALFSFPCLVIGGLLLAHNYARFESLSEFGHTYLAGGGLQRVKEHGLFNTHFLSKNLTAAFTLIPKFQAAEPYVIISKHGMSLLLTTPAFIWLFRPMPRDSAPDVFWWRALWATVFVTALPGFFYQNTGYEQFGFRFSLDYTVYLILLIAVGRRPLTKVFKALVLWGVAVNAFGAATFKRVRAHYSESFFV
ncbi:DUF2029 domain-containing protein [Microvenator marinus]|uniref:DUF2029 domain-containing protein n=1 Tax=Microvenator marinus TaxID=2600177 RepID=A0A5B8Y0B7_9DELT|nr:glycosyltransferase family 87 protein [Microvenator marinus]QED29099.1 DUF2029 domain-containing protein [Microvenator marinus]